MLPRRSVVGPAHDVLEKLACGYVSSPETLTATNSGLISTGYLPLFRAREYDSVKLRR